MKRLIGVIALSAMFSVAAAGVVLAQTKTTTKPVVAPAQSQAGGTLAPLTEAECTGLGGKNFDVVSATCPSMRMCRRADEDGVIHSVCISKSN
jgi:hypothetical protein